MATAEASNHSGLPYNTLSPIKAFHQGQMPDLTMLTTGENTLYNYPVILNRSKICTLPPIIMKSRSNKQLAPKHSFSTQGTMSELYLYNVEFTILTISEWMNCFKSIIVLQLRLYTVTSVLEFILDNLSEEFMKFPSGKTVTGQWF